MRLFIFRHGKAVDRSEWSGSDADRPLTKSGAQRTRQVCERLRPLVKADLIFTSPWARARSTAEIAAECWRLPLREASWLAGESLTLSEVCAALTDQRPAVLVGHEPGLGELIGHLCGLGAVPLKKAGFAMLDGDPQPSGMRLQGLLTPKLVDSFRSV
jgi:phosphohistidine phosphatase SixA